MKPSAYNFVFPYQFNRDYSVVYNAFRDTAGIVTAREAEYIQSCDGHLGIHYTKIEDFKNKGFIIDETISEPENSKIEYLKSKFERKASQTGASECAAEPEDGQLWARLVNAYVVKQLLNCLKVEGFSSKGDDSINMDDLIMGRYGEKYDQFLHNAPSTYCLGDLSALAEKNHISLNTEDGELLLQLIQPTGLAI